MLVLTFPGQGSQQPGMGRPWAGHPSWEVVDELSVAAGRDLHHLLVDASADELRDTRNAQLATYTVSLVVFDAVTRSGMCADAVAGHSLGEYTALVAAGALERGAGTKLVSERARAMHDAGERRPGTMAAVLGLDREQVELVCRDVAGDVWLANDNAPGQAVLAGRADAVARAGELAKDRGAKRVLPVAVSGAFHTPMMEPAREHLVEAIARCGLRRPHTTVHANVDAAAHDDPSAWADLLAAQLTSPVRWRETVQNLRAAGCTAFVELGPGSVLTGLTKRTVAGCATLAVAAPDDLERLGELAR